MDASGNVYVSGYSPGEIGNDDYFTVKYNSGGVKQWAARYNGPGNGEDRANALALDGAGNVYVTGRSARTGGNADYATIKYSNAGAQQWIARYNAPANNTDEARDIAVDSEGNVHITGYILAANGQPDYMTIKYSASSASAQNTQMAEAEGEILDEGEEGENESSHTLAQESTVPARFVLSQNYPNPFNPNTTISFTLPVASEIKLAIYNVTGERIRTLLAGALPPGEHELTFVAGDLASGTYFYRLEAGDFTATQRMILAK